MKIENLIPSSRTVTRVVGGAMVVLATASGPTRCEALNPDVPEASPTVATVPAGTNFYTKPHKLGDTACGTTIIDLTGLVPEDAQTEQSAQMVATTEGYKAEVVAGALGPGNNCGDGDENGLLWRESQVTRVAGPPPGGVGF